MVGWVARSFGKLLLFVVIGLCLAVTIVPHFLDARYYRGASTGHFDGERFANPDGDDTSAPPAGSSRGGFLMRMLTDKRPPWPDRIAVRPGAPPARVDGDAMIATWIGHATMLVQTQGINILTDPVWSERAGPLGIGPGRVARPGVDFDTLPKIDLIVVSHNHYDHMDLATLKRLWDRDKPLIVTSLGNDSVIGQAGVPARTADWGGRVPVRPGIDVIVNRNHHWGSRWFADRNRAARRCFGARLQPRKARGMREHPERALGRAVKRDVAVLQRRRQRRIHGCIAEHDIGFGLVARGGALVRGLGHDPVPSRACVNRAVI